MVKSFFDPNWMDLGLLGVYGRVWGVNWVWSMFLTLYHAVFSIAIPIYLTELIYPAVRDECWLTRRGVRSFAVLLTADVLFGFLLLTTYRPPFLPYTLSIITVLFLGWLGKRMPLRWWQGDGGKVRGTFWFFLVGALGSFGLFLTNYLLPTFDVPVILTLAVCAAIPFVLLVAVRWLSGRGTWVEKQRLALVTGGMSFLIFGALVAETSTDRMDNPAGMAVVGMLTIVAFVILRVIVGRRERHASAMASA